jgi:large subunit ribosomal protein L17
MRHKYKGRKFGRNAGHRKALIMNLAKAVIKHESIETTLPKAKDIRPLVEKLITKGRDNSLHVRRQLHSFFGNDSEIVNKILNDLSPRFANRPGGYLRIVKTGYRQGDAAPMAIIQFVEEAATATAA